MKAEVDRLAAEGGRDLAAHFEARPEEVARVSQRIEDGNAVVRSERLKAIGC